MLAALSVAGSADPTRAHEVAILKSADIAAYNQAARGFKASMPSTTRFIEYDLEGDSSQGRTLARKIRASKIDLVLAVGLKAAVAARLEIFDIPVIFCMVLHPAKYDLDAQNMVGISLKIPVSQQLSILRTVLPHLKRIGFLYDPRKTPRLSTDATRQARKLGITVIERRVRTEKQVPKALRELLPEIEALWLIPDSTVLTEESFSFLLGMAFDQGVPVIGFHPEFVRRGALVGLSVDSGDVGRQAGRLAQAILDGLMIPSPKIFPPKRRRISLNLGTAEYLGITIPPDVVSTADEVY